MNDPKFHTERLTGIGGSDAPAVVGVDAYGRTQVDVYLEKRGEAPPRHDPTPQMQWGTRLEPVIMTAFRERGHPDLVYAQPMARSAKYEFMLAHLDGRTKNAIVNAKTARSADGWGEDGSSEAPAYPIVQVHHEMIVADVQLAYIPVLIAGSDFRVIEVPYDKELGEMIISAEHHLWTQIKTGEPPEPRTLSDVNALYRHSKPEGVEADEDLYSIYRLLLDTKTIIARSEKDAEELEKQLKAALTFRDTLTYQGKILCTWRENPTKRLDSTRLKKENPELWEEYAVESTSRRFLLK